MRFRKEGHEGPLPLVLARHRLSPPHPTAPPNTAAKAHGAGRQGGRERACLPAGQAHKGNQNRNPVVVERFSHDGARPAPQDRTGARPGARNGPHRRPGVPTTPPTARSGTHARRQGTAGHPLPAAASGGTRHAPRPGAGGGVWGNRGRAGPSHGSPRARLSPTHRGGRATPLRVFKPPRRNALGTWRGGDGTSALCRGEAEPPPPNAGNRRRPRPDARTTALPTRDGGTPSRAGRQEAAAAAEAARPPAPPTGPDHLAGDTPEGCPPRGPRPDGDHDDTTPPRAPHARPERLRRGSRPDRGRGSGSASETAGGRRIFRPEPHAEGGTLEPS